MRGRGRRRMPRFLIRFAAGSFAARSQIGQLVTVRFAGLWFVIWRVDVVGVLCGRRGGVAGVLFDDFCPLFDGAGEGVGVSAGGGEGGGDEVVEGVAA